MKKKIHSVYWLVVLGWIFATISQTNLLVTMASVAVVVTAWYFVVIGMAGAWSEWRAYADWFRDMLAIMAATALSWWILN